MKTLLLTFIFAIFSSGVSAKINLIDRENPQETMSFRCLDSDCLELVVTSSNGRYSREEVVSKKKFESLKTPWKELGLLKTPDTSNYGTFLSFYSVGTESALLPAAASIIACLKLNYPPFCYFVVPGVVASGALLPLGLAVDIVKLATLAPTQIVVNVISAPVNYERFKRFKRKVIKLTPRSRTKSFKLRKNLFEHIKDRMDYL